MTDDTGPGPGHDDETRLPQPSDEAPTVTGGAETAGTELSAGDLFGRFRILSLLGRGGMGRVYEAEEVDGGRRVALKVLDQALSAEQHRQRFLREGRLAAAINHPNCVYVFGAEEIGGTPVIAMEIVTSGTLTDRVRDHGPMRSREAVDAILDVVAGLEAAATAGILHRDVKPSNCIVDDEGRVKISDFGLSISTVSRDQTQLTATGSFMGTPAFASPEQLQGEELDERSDIYSVGATLYYLLTGKPPFEADNPVKLLASIIQRQATPPSERRDGVPADLDRVVIRCLGKSPDERPASYAQLRNELAPYGSAAPIPAPLLPRMGAGLIDHLLIAAPFAVPSIVSVYAGSMVAFTTALFPALLLCYVLYWTVTESLWGRSLGKLLAGIRVTDSSGGRASWKRIAVRALLFEFLRNCPLLLSPAFRFGLSRDEQVRALLSFEHQAIGMFTAFWFLALFATARRSNGFAAVHDLLGGLRVVADRRDTPGRVSSVAATVPETDARLGPYLVQDAATGDDRTVIAAYDPRLRRQVWIRRQPTGAPAVPPERRDLGRATRLRWLGGRREADECWDAYEAPHGSPLTLYVSRRRPWSSVRRWLGDLTGELDAMLKAGESVSIDPNRLWITPDGRGKLLDFDPPDSQRSTSGDPVEIRDLRTAQLCLGRAAQSALEGRLLASDEATDRVPSMPLALPVRSFVTALSRASFNDWNSLQFALSRVANRDMEVSVRRRAAQVLTSLVPVSIGLVYITLICLWLAFVVGDTVRSVTAEGASLRTGLGCLRSCSAQAGDADSSPDALRTVLRGRFGHLRPQLTGGLANMTLPEPGERLDMTDLIGTYLLQGILWPERDLVAEVFSDGELPTKAELLAAEEQVPTVTLERMESVGRRVQERITPGYFVTSGWMFWSPLIMIGTLLAVFAALIFRGGPLLTVFGIAVVGANGARVSRWRTLLRAAVAWMPLFLAAALMLIVATTQDLDGLTTLHTGLIAIAMLLPVAAAVWGMVWLTRGAHDRLARTYLVLR